MMRLSATLCLGILFALAAGGCRTPLSGGDAFRTDLELPPSPDDHVPSIASDRRGPESLEQLLDELDPAAEPTRPSLIERHLVQAHESLQRGEIDSARRAYEKVIIADPNHFVAHHRLGVLADQRFDFQAAEEHYLTALRTNPTDPELLSDLGYSYVLQERWADGERLLGQALKYDPHHVRATNNLGLLYARTNRRQEALAMFRRTSNEAEAQTRLAQISGPKISHVTARPPQATYSETQAPAGSPQSGEQPGPSDLTAQLKGMMQDARLRDLHSRQQRQSLPAAVQQANLEDRDLNEAFAAIDRQHPHQGTAHRPSQPGALPQQPIGNGHQYPPQWPGQSVAPAANVVPTSYQQPAQPAHPVSQPHPQQWPVHHQQQPAHASAVPEWNGRQQSPAAPPAHRLQIIPGSPGVRNSHESRSAAHPSQPHPGHEPMAPSPRNIHRNQQAAAHPGNAESGMPQLSLSGVRRRALQHGMDMGSVFPSYAAPPVDPRQNPIQRPTHESRLGHEYAQPPTYTGQPHPNSAHQYPPSSSVNGYGTGGTIATSAATAHQVAYPVPTHSPGHQTSHASGAGPYPANFASTPPVPHITSPAVGGHSLPSR